MGENKIKSDMAIALSGEQIQKLLPYNVRVFRYPEIKDFDNVDRLLEPYGAAVILFDTSKLPTGQHMGHWTALMRTFDDDRNSSINFFDSYGFIPDDEKKYIDKQYMNVVGMTDNYLTKLLWDSKKKYDDVIEYNEVKLQKMNKDISTCGRHVAMRLIMKDISMNEYQDFMRSLVKKYKKTPDEIVTILTQPVLDNQMTANELRDLLVELLHELD